MYALLDTHRITKLGLWVNRPETISILDFNFQNPEHVSQFRLELKRYYNNQKRVRTAIRYEPHVQAYYMNGVAVLHKDVYQCIQPWCKDTTWIPLEWENPSWPFAYGALIIKDRLSDRTLPRWIYIRPDDFLWPTHWESEFVVERSPCLSSLWLPDAAVKALKEQLSPDLLATLDFCPLSFAEPGQPAQLKPGVEQTPERSRFWLPEKNILFAVED